MSFVRRTTIPPRKAYFTFSSIFILSSRSFFKRALVYEILNLKKNKTSAKKSRSWFEKVKVQRKLSNEQNFWRNNIRCTTNRICRKYNARGKHNTNRFRNQQLIGWHTCTVWLPVVCTLIKGRRSRIIPLRLPKNGRLGNV